MAARVANDVRRVTPNRPAVGPALLVRPLAVILVHGGLVIGQIEVDQVAAHVMQRSA